MTRRVTGGGRYDPDEGFVYFVAGHGMTGFLTEHKHTLVPVTGIRGWDDVELTGRLDDPASRVMLDCGAFSLAAAHASKHGMELHEAFRLDTHLIDGYDEVLASYLQIARRQGDRLWGYVEVDLGGTDAKRTRREAMERDGLSPIPVYHPLSDPWSYFDELCEVYDRVCVGNLVKCRPEIRKRILVTLWERHRRHRGVWIHLLGLTPNHIAMAYPYNSADASSFVYSLRYGSQAMPSVTAMGAPYSRFDRGYTYIPGPYGEQTPTSRKAAIELLAAQAHFHQESWRRAYADLANLTGCEPYPDPLPGEPTPTPMEVTP